MRAKPAYYSLKGALYSNLVDNGVDEDAILDGGSQLP